MSNKQIDIVDLANKQYPFSSSEKNAFLTGYNTAKARNFDEQEQLLFKYFEWHKLKGYEKHEVDHFAEFYKETYYDI